MNYNFKLLQIETSFFKISPVELSYIFFFHKIINQSLKIKNYFFDRNLDSLILIYVFFNFFFFSYYIKDRIFQSLAKILESI